MGLADEIINGTYKNPYTQKKKKDEEVVNQNVENNNTSGIFKKSNAFDDGYQFGDVSKTIGSTLANAGTSIIKGMGNVAEGVSDFGTHVAAQIIDWAGNKEWADRTRKRAIEDDNAQLFNGIQKNFEGNSVLGETSNQILESVGYSTALMPFEFVSPHLGTAVMFTSATGSGLNEAYSQEGVTNTQAWIKGVGSGLIETATEKMFGLFGTSGLDTGIANTISSRITSGLGKSLVRMGVQGLGEAAEEGISYTANYILDRVIDNFSNGKGAKFSKEWNWEELGQQMGIAFVSASLIGMATNVAQVTQIATNEKINLKDAINEAGFRSDVKAQAEDLNNEIEGIKKKLRKNPNNSRLANELKSKYVQLNMLVMKNDFMQDNTINNSKNVENNNINTQTQRVMPMQNKMSQNQTSEQIQLPIRNYQYVETENTKINNLRQDMSKYWTDTNETKALGSVIEKIITDKGYNVRLDNTIKNQKGNSANAQITTLNNGEVEIRINPNAKNVGEFLLMHETTHAIGTQEIKDLVMDYASKNTEFNSALESLKETYGVQDVSDEVLADISGQLFENQEFINNLSMEKPNIFKRIYNKIIELANKITGNSNEALFVRDLANKWQEAYRTQNNTSNIANSGEMLYNTNERESDIYDTTRNYNTNNETEKIGTNESILPTSTSEVRANEIYEQNSREVEIDVKKYIKDNLGFKDAIINDIYNKISNNENITIDDIYNSFDDYREIYQDVDQDIIDTVKRIKNDLRNTRIDISSIKLEITDYNDFKKHNWGKLRLANNGIQIDSFYKELIETYPGYFDENIINPTEQLLALSEWRNIDAEELIRPTSYKLTNSDLENVANYMLNAMEYLNSIKNLNKSSFFNENNYSLPTKQWQQHLSNNYKATGTRTNLEDIKLPTKEYFENKKMQEVLTDADYEVLNKIYEKDGKTEILTERKKARLLEKYANDKFAIKDSLDILAQKFINKGHYIDQLSQKANNPELKFAYDKNLNSFAEGQYVVGVAQTDNQGNNIGKSINDIWKPIEDKGLTKEFSEYLLHKHNIDRSGRNKFIFGEEIGPTESTAIALELESKHPEFKQYAKDIKKFNHNNLNNLKEAGMLTQDTIDYIEAMYPNYIAISRNLEDSLYTESNDKTGARAPLKKATGGNADIQPIKETMAQQAIRIKRLINQNELGKELSKTLKNSTVDEGVDISLSPTMLLDMDTMVDTDVEGNKYYLYFEDGKQLKLKINDNLYESLKPTEISKIEKTLPIKTLQKVNNIHRSLLTSSNPLFIVTNFFKDFQDGAFNSKYSSKFIKNYGKALNEICTKGKYYESYMANGGMSNTYFDYETGIKKTNKFVEKIRNANEIVEQLPRLAEFISTLEDGKSLNEALYNAAEITTNFKRGGDITKAINRNGVNFLNASIQGLDKQFRNFSGQNGAKGYVNLLAKATIMSIIPAIFNHMLLDDDEDYQDLPQSTKDLYYLFKCDDGKFIRIPKGRVLSIFGAAARRTLETVQGQDDAWDGFGSTIVNQVAPNNPLEDNILAPITQVKNNKTWYGSDLVSSRLQKELPENQYDETTDNFSKWLGKQIKVSPKKINYLIDQYSGGIGDIILPMITPQAKQNVLVDKFTTDSVLKNKNVSKFYETLEKQTQIANDNFATDEDELQLKYLNSISKDMGDLYKEKRQVQMSDISNKEKTQKVREIQKQIDQLAEKGLTNYKNINQNTNSSKIGDEEYYKNSNGEWTILTDEEKNKNTNISTETYSEYKQKIYNKKNEKISNGELNKNQDLKNKDKIQILLDSKYSEKEKKAIYENYIISSSDTEYAVMSKTGINFTEYLKYKQQDFSSDKKDDGTTTGKTVSGSKKTKVYDYINNMNIDYNQKLVLLGTQYTLTSSEKSKLANYINELSIKKDEKLKIYEKLKGFTVYKNGRVTW